MTSVGRAPTVAPTATPAATPAATPSSAPGSKGDGAFATVLTAAGNSTVPGDTDTTTATDHNSTGNEESTPSSSPGAVDQETATPTVNAPTTTTPTTTATTNDPTTSKDATTNDATTNSDLTTSDAVAEFSSATLTDSADPAAPASASTIVGGIEQDSADGSDPAEIDAAVPAAAPLAFGVSPVPVAHDIDRSGSSEGGPDPRQTATVVASPRATAATTTDATTTGATTTDAVTTGAVTTGAATTGAATTGAGPVHGQANQPVIAPTPPVSGVSQQVDVPTPDATVVSQPVTVPIPHLSAAAAAVAAVAAAEPVAEPAAAPVTEPVLHTSTPAAGAATGLASSSPEAERAGTSARAEAVRPATEVPAVVADRQAAASGPTPSSPSMVSSGTGVGVPVSATLPFAGADLAAWRHFRSGSTSTMSMEVDTDTLGQLRIAASDLDGAVRLSLLSDDALSRQLLAERLPELRRDFADAGIDFADLDVADRNAGQRHSESSDRTDRDATSRTGASTATTDRMVASISSPQTVPTGHLDLRL